ncbi:MAG: mannonate dehydratase [Bacteroidota bacterium]
MKKSLRWFGPADRIRLEELVQTGVESVVTALHHIPNGEVWPEEEIIRRKELLRSYLLDWDVVESVPVHESIKTGEAERDLYIHNYCRTLENLGKHGISTVCYNFMTVVDWVRTNLNYKLPNGRETMYFSLTDLAVFDLYLLGRPGAQADYSGEILEKAERRNREMSAEEKKKLVKIITVDSQNFIDGTLTKSGGDPLTTFRAYLEKYRTMDREQLFSNLKYFLERVVPVAEKSGIRLAIHADDPPFSVFGLPRIVSTGEDLQRILDAVNSPANGLTFCTGSLSGSLQNDVPAMAARFAPHIHFLHLRNTEHDQEGNFRESDHLNGCVDMAAVMEVIVKEMNRRKAEGRPDHRITVRPDHGHRMLSDLGRESNPGYSLIGRLKGLAEIDGLEKGIEFHIS